MAIKSTDPNCRNFYNELSFWSALLRETLTAIIYQFVLQSLAEEDYTAFLSDSKALRKNFMTVRRCGKLEITRMEVGTLLVNCYFLSSSDCCDAVLIDPGNDAETIAEVLKKQDISDLTILLTHGHFDHTAATSELANTFPVNISMSKKDEFLLPSAGEDFAKSMGYFGEVFAVDEDIVDGSEIKFCDQTLRAIHTPGHSPGSMCFYTEIDEQPILFSGDTLFQLGVGRADLPGGNWDLLLENIETKLFTLPGNTRVLPGHGPETTIEFEQKKNPFLR